MTYSTALATGSLTTIVRGHLLANEDEDKLEAVPGLTFIFQDLPNFLWNLLIQHRELLIAWQDLESSGGFRIGPSQRPTER
jgi:hypothetical protein